MSRDLSNAKFYCEIVTSQVRDGKKRSNTEQYVIRCRMSMSMSYSAILTN